MSSWGTRVHSEAAPYGRSIAVVAIAGAAWAVWASGPGWTTPAFAAAAVGWAALGVIDARTRRLPDVVNIPTTATTAGLLVLAAIATGASPDLARAALAALALTAGYAMVWFIAPAGGVGLGDVKLAASIGLITGWVGWETVVIAALVPWLVAAVPAAVVLLLGRARDDRHLPFGPYMIVGAIAAVTWTALHA